MNTTKMAQMRVHRILRAEAGRGQRQQLKRQALPQQQAGRGGWSHCSLYADGACCIRAVKAGVAAHAPPARGTTAGSALDTHVISSSRVAFPGCASLTAMAPPIELPGAPTLPVDA